VSEIECFYIFEKFSHQDKFPSGALSWWEFTKPSTLHLKSWEKCLKLYVFTFLKSFLIRTNFRVVHCPDENSQSQSFYTSKAEKSAWNWVFLHFWKVFSSGQIPK